MGEALQVFEAASHVAQFAEEIDDAVCYLHLPQERIKQLAGDAGLKNATVRLIGARSGARIYVPTPDEEDLTITLEGGLDEIRTGALTDWPG